MSYKYILLILFFINVSNAFTNIPMLNNKNNYYNKPKSVLNLKRRSIYKYIPLICSPLITYAFDNKNEKSIEELRSEANRIIEIIDAQKEAFNLPSLQDTRDTQDTQDTRDTRDTQDIENLLNNILSKFKEDKEGNKSLVFLQNNCAPSNVIKYKQIDKLKASFNDGKYSLLLGKFTNYTIAKYEYIYDNDVNTSYYNVDVKIEADYKTMIYNSIQFDDMYYPEKNSVNNNCYVVYRWILTKYDDKYLIDGCYLLHK
jgi:uncharacterized protein YlaN (UPF0358 family)